MGVYASAYSVVVRNDTAEVVYPGGLGGYIRSSPNATFCTDGHVSRVGFMDHDAVLVFIERLIDLGFYANPEGGQDIAVVQQDRGVISTTPWACFKFVDGVPVCYLAQSSVEPIAYPAHGPSEKLTYIDAGDIPWLRFVEHSDGLDVWEDTRTEKRHYTAVMSASSGHGLRGLRLEYINDRLLSLYAEVEKALEGDDAGLPGWIKDELEKLREEVERLEKIRGAHHGHALYCAGLANRLLGRYSQAAVFYRICLVTSSENLSLLLEQTLCLGELGRTDEARVMALRSVKVAPESAAAWGNLAGSCMNLGLRSEARSALDRALKIDPENTINLGMDKEFESFFAPKTHAVENRSRGECYE